MRLLLIGLVWSLATSCISPLKENKFTSDWNQLSRLKINKDTQEDVKLELGTPDEVYTEQLGPNEEQWNYVRDGVPKIRLLFINKILQSFSTSIWNQEPLTSLELLLKEFSGSWQIVKEEPISPHYMPFHCYLVDELSGKKIQIHAYKKIAVSISKWNPNIPQVKSQKGKKYADVDENRCSWLKLFLKE